MDLGWRSCGETGVGSRLENREVLLKGVPVKKPDIKPIAWVGIFLTLYVASYGILRTAGTFVNMYNALNPEGNGITAHKMEWHDLSVKLAADKSLFLGLVEDLRGRVPQVLEAVYWPLRELEFAFWKTTNRYEEIH